MAPEKGKARQGEPPQDGQEWLCRQQLTELYGWSPATITRFAQRFQWTCYRPPNHCQHWYLKADIVPYAKFLQERDNWRKRNDPKHWEMMFGIYADHERPRCFLTSAQAAAFLGVSIGRVQALARRGKIPVFFARKPGRGQRYWYSPTALRNYRDDEERVNRRAIYAKAVETRRRRKSGLESKPEARHRRNADIPKGWLVSWQVAERCGVSEVVVNRWRRRKYIDCTRFPRKRGRMSPWSYSKIGVEEFLASEEYRHIRAIWDARNPVTVEKKLPVEDALSPCGYSRQELLANRELFVPLRYEEMEVW